MPSTQEIANLFVTLSLNGNAVAQIGLLMERLLGVSKATDHLQSKLTRVKIAAAGAAAAMAGARILDGMWTMVKYGDKLVEQQVKLRGLGVSRAHTKQATDAAINMAQTVGTDPAHNLATIRELRGVLKNTQEAIAAAPTVLHAQMALAQFGLHTDGVAGLLSVIKGLDLKGGFIKNGQLDVGALSQAVKESVAALSLTGGLLTPHTFYRFTRMAGPAAVAMNTEAYLKDYTEVMMGLGPSGGRGMQQAATRFLGGQLTKANVGQLEQLGLVKASDIVDDHGHFAFRAGHHIAGYKEMLGKGFAHWFHDVMLPAMTKHGMTGPTAVLQALGSFPATVQRLFSFFYTNWPQIGKFGGQYDKAVGTDQNAVLKKGSLAYNLNLLSNAWDGFLEAAGSPMVKPAIEGVQMVTNWIKRLEAWTFAHKEAARLIGEVITAIGGALLVLGGVAVFAALASLAGPTGLIVALAAGVGILYAEFKKPDWVAIGDAIVWAVREIAHAFEWVYDKLASFVKTVFNLIPYDNKGLHDIHQHGAQVPWWWLLPAGPAGRAPLPFDPNFNDYAPGHAPIIPPTSNKSLTVHTHVNLDGKKVGEAVTKYQTDQLNRMQFPSPFDLHTGPLYPSGAFQP